LHLLCCGRQPTMSSNCAGDYLGFGVVKKGEECLSGSGSVGRLQYSVDASCKLHKSK
jgi:hypothetical protein